MTRKDDSLVEMRLEPLTVSKENHPGSDYIIELQVPAKYNQGQVHHDLHKLLLEKYPDAKILP